MRDLLRHYIAYSGDGVYVAAIALPAGSCSAGIALDITGNLVLNLVYNEQS